MNPFTQPSPFCSLVARRSLAMFGLVALWQCLVGQVTLVEAAAPQVRVEVFPPSAQLTTNADWQGFVVVATRPDGVTQDVTAQASLRVADEQVARLDREAMRLLPTGNGQTKLLVDYAGQQVELDITVSEAEAERPISFNLDVMPVLMRAGCNTGSCHGAARGKDGFMLSLFGYDPSGDHERITRELAFRRVNLALPRESMILEKCDGSVPHTGGKRFSKDDPYYTALLRWLEAGVPNDTGNVPQVVRVELFPPQVVLEGEGATQQLVVRAHYTDGTNRDVTHLAVFLSNNDNSVLVDKQGKLSAAARGEAFVMARFDTHTVGIHTLALPVGTPLRPIAEPPVNYIDSLVNAKLDKLRIQPSALCSDEVFLRRVMLDIVGTLPSEAEYHEFLNDPNPNKRSELIDRLLERHEFAEIWAMKWAEILLVRTVNNQVDYKTVHRYANWLTDQIHNHVPINQIVNQLLTASGSAFNNPPAAFYQTQRQTLALAENSAQLFLGMRIQCAQCHNHPFDRWTMDDYYSYAAFFAQVGRKTAEDPRDTIVFDRRTGDVNNPVTRRTMKPKPLGGAVVETTNTDRREALAQWLTSTENPYFATNVSNRIWEHFFGIGIVEPVDDIRVSNPPSNPELFEELGKRLVAYDYDYRRLVRDICNSNTYQRATDRNDTNYADETNFSRARVRRLKAESLLDCISQVTESYDKFRGLPLGARAVQIVDGRTSNYFLNTFGRSQRETVCAADASTDPTLSQSLHLLTGPTLDGKIRRGNVVRKLLAEEGKTPDEVITTLYVRALTRQPTAQELERLKAIMAAETDRQKALEDVFWAILNSREFVFNH